MTDVRSIAPSNPSNAASSSVLDEHDAAEDFDVWVCRFDPCEATDWGAHHHHQHQLAWVSSGFVTASVPGRVWTIPANSGIWLPSGVTHDVQPAPGATLYCLYAWPEACPLQWQEPTVVSISPVLRELIVLLTSSADETPVAAAAATLLFELLSPQPSVALPMPTDPQAEAIAQALCADPDRRWGVEDWARHGHLSVSTLRRRFLAETGLTFGDWRRQARLQAALPLLVDGESVQRVASRVGYASANGFIEAFKRRFGSTPGDYVTRSG